MYCCVMQFYLVKLAVFCYESNFFAWELVKWFIWCGG